MTLYSNSGIQRNASFHSQKSGSSALGACRHPGDDQSDDDDQLNPKNFHSQQTDFKAQQKGKLMKQTLNELTGGTGRNDKNKQFSVSMTEQKHLGQSMAAKKIYSAGPNEKFTLISGGGNATVDLDRDSSQDLLGGVGSGLVSSQPATVGLAQRYNGSAQQP